MERYFILSGSKVWDMSRAEIISAADQYMSRSGAEFDLADDILPQAVEQIGVSAYPVTREGARDFINDARRVGAKNPARRLAVQLLRRFAN